MANQRLSKKIFNICIVFIIIVIIIFVAVMLMLNYSENGETNMPFKISKITVISSAEGTDNEDSENKWDINVVLNNDIYLYVEKNNSYRKQEMISSIKIDNFNIRQSPKIGELKIYRPINDSTALFKNLEENEIKEIEFLGGKTTDTRNLQISNQGGVISFRCANNNLGKYTSNDEQEEINHDNLINKLNIQQENLTSKISFNIIITLDSGKVFKAENIEIQIPNEDIINKGTVGKEYTNLENIIFKRIEN